MASYPNFVDWLAMRLGEIDWWAVAGMVSAVVIGLRFLVDQLNVPRRKD